MTKNIFFTEIVQLSGAMRYLVLSLRLNPRLKFTIRRLRRSSPMLGNFELMIDTYKRKNNLIYFESTIRNWINIHQALLSQFSYREEFLFHERIYANLVNFEVYRKVPVS